MQESQFDGYILRLTGYCVSMERIRGTLCCRPACNDVGPTLIIGKRVLVEQPVAEVDVLARETPSNNDARIYQIIRMMIQRMKCECQLAVNNYVFVTMVPQSGCCLDNLKNELFEFVISISILILHVIK